MATIKVYKAAKKGPGSQPNTVDVPKGVTPMVVDYQMTEEDDDWMKSLPGYKDELKIIEDVGRQHSKIESKPAKAKRTKFVKKSPKKD